MILKLTLTMVLLVLWLVLNYLDWGAIGLGGIVDDEGWTPSQIRSSERQLLFLTVVWVLIVTAAAGLLAWLIWAKL